MLPTRSAVIANDYVLINYMHKITHFFFTAILNATLYIFLQESCDVTFTTIVDCVHREIEMKHLSQFPIGSSSN